MVTVSQKEFQRVKVIENAVAGRLSLSEAAGLLQLSERQVQRLKRRYEPVLAAVILSLRANTTFLVVITGWESGKPCRCKGGRDTNP